MYERTTWTAGDTITASKLNHLEGGVESVSTIVDSAVATGGIGYTDPDTLLITAERDTTVDPAIIELAVDVEYTFKIVDAEYPEGVVLTDRAWYDDKANAIVWSNGIDSVVYEIRYQDNVNTFVSWREEEVEVDGDIVINSTPHYPVSFYQLGEVHKISSELVLPTYLTVHFSKDGSNNWRCDTSAQMIYSAAYRREDVIGWSGDRNSPERYTLSYAAYDRNRNCYYAQFYRCYTSSVNILAYDGTQWTSTEYTLPKV